MVLMDAVLRQRARMGAPCQTLGELGHGQGTAAKRLAVPWCFGDLWSDTVKNGD